MPAKTAKQYRFMQAIAHGSSNKGLKVGPSKDVALEMIHKTPKEKRSQFAKRKRFGE